MIEKNYIEINNLINELSSEVNKISFEKQEKYDLNQSSNLNNTRAPINYHYVDNSWNSFYDNRNYSQNYNQANPQKSNKDDDEEEKKKEGNHPLVFLIAAGALSFGATYLIATDDYRKIKNRFSELDRLVNKISDKTKNTLIEDKYINLKDSYDKFKESLFSKYSPSFYSKLGIIGSSLVTLTYFFPFGTIALFPGIIGLTGFGCYWLWNYLTNDDYEKIVTNHKNLLKSLEDFRNELNKVYSNSIPVNYEVYNWNNQQYYSGVTPNTTIPSAPTFNIN